MRNAAGAYRSNSILTASPAELTLMLYNGAIKFCSLAIDNTEKKNIQEAHNYNMRVQDIITELRITLDKSYEIANEFDKFYIYILELLRDGNINKNVEKLKEAKWLITEFRDTWKELMHKGA